MREAITREYFTPNGRCAADTQTAYVVALYMELTPESMRPRLIAELRRKLRENDMKLTTGFVGTPYLCRVLSQYGASEDAYTLLLNEEMPGWLYEVKMGATTVWESAVETDEKPAFPELSGRAGFVQEGFSGTGSSFGGRLRLARHASGEQPAVRRKAR